MPRLPEFENTTWSLPHPFDRSLGTGVIGGTVVYRHSQPLAQFFYHLRYEFPPASLRIESDTLMVKSSSDRLRLTPSTSFDGNG